MQVHVTPCCPVYPILACPPDGALITFEQADDGCLISYQAALSYLPSTSVLLCFAMGFQRVHVICIVNVTCHVFLYCHHIGQHDQKGKQAHILQTPHQGRNESQFQYKYKYMCVAAGAAGSPKRAEKDIQ